MILATRLEAFSPVAKMVSSTASRLMALVRRLIDDPATPLPVRNECHLLLIAIERNQRPLIEESLLRLARITDISPAGESDVDAPGEKA
jgi:hypothetical protein